MIQDDWLLRQFNQFAAALAGAQDEIATEQFEQAGDGLDRMARDAVGLSLDALDRLPPIAILGATASLDPRRKRAIQDVLGVAAELAEAQGQPGLAAVRRSKAKSIGSAT